MYKIDLFSKNLCNQDNYNKCRHYNILGVRLNFPFDFPTNLLNLIAPCDRDNFSFIFWYATILSFFGLVLTLFEFLTVLHGTKTPSTFRNRQYRVLPEVIRRNGRLIGSAIMTILYVLLLIGVIFIYPDFINPWLIVQGAMLVLETLFWFIDVLSGVDCGSILSMISFIMIYYSWIFVLCIKNTFELIISQGMTVNYTT